MSNTDTIYALASAPGRAGVAVLRVSGSHTASVIEALTGMLPVPRHAQLCRFTAPGSDEVIDAGLALWFPAPRSYTGEDMAELQLHGSRAVLAAISSALSSLGCRLAEPGEFTRRAVVNGKLDLTAAEGVADLVDAETQAQRRQALRQLGGGLADTVSGWRERLTKLEAHLVAAIDFADDDLPPDLLSSIRAGLEALRDDLKAALEGSRSAQRLRAGVYAAILGAPNAGKSSLLNRLAQRDVAIVTPIAGTTRDVLEVDLELGGYPLTLADTAGLRESDDVVEQEGIRRARERAALADFKILLIDAAAPDTGVLQHYAPGDLVVVNKTDIPVRHPSDMKVYPREGGGWDLAGPREDASFRWHDVSVKTNTGLSELIEALTRRTAELAGLTPAPALTRARHREVVEGTLIALERALRPGLNIDQLAEDVRLASRTLGRLTGQTGIEDLLDVVFRDFCLGK